MLAKDISVVGFVAYQYSRANFWLEALSMHFWIHLDKQKQKKYVYIFFLKISQFKDQN